MEVFTYFEIPVKAIKEELENFNIKNREGVLEGYRRMELALPPHEFTILEDPKDVIDLETNTPHKQRVFGLIIDLDDGQMQALDKALPQYEQKFVRVGEKVITTHIHKGYA